LYRRDVASFAYQSVFKIAGPDHKVIAGETVRFMVRR
jgi:hypothetical protein